MLRFGVFNLVAAILQLTVPSYGLRLVRRFGAQRVGWFLVIAFGSLALVHLAQPIGSPGAGWASNQNLVYVLASVLLLIGMGHLETLFSDRFAAKCKDENLHSWFKLQLESMHRSQAEMEQDIAHKEEVQKALHESEAYYRFLFIENPVAMCIVDLRSLRFLAVNKAALRQYGFALEEFMELKLPDLADPSRQAAFLRDVVKRCSAEEVAGSCEHRRKDHSLLHVESAAMDLRYGSSPARLLVLKDVSSIRKRELESREAVKMETIGHVAAGTAHHFNNLLTIIDGHASQLLRESTDARITEQLGHISAGANRAAALTRQLLAAGGRLMLNTSQINLNELLRNSIPMLRRLVGERIILQESLFSNLPPIEADAQALKHVMVNLVLNGRDAIQGKGMITITTSTVRIERCRTQQTSRAGEFVRLSIHDTGCGMTPEVQARVFEPFFSTREIGNGTGLGLASAYGLVRQQSGWIEFTSNPGDGTEFRIFFPAKPSVLSADKELETTTRKGIILLIEPQDRSRDLARYILSRRGYHVIEADCSSTALVLWESGASAADILLTDSGSVGELSGTALADRLRKQKPSLKVIYTSEINASAEGQEPVQAALQGFPFVPKPFTADRLLQGVKAAMAPTAGSKNGGTAAVGLLTT